MSDRQVILVGKTEPIYTEYKDSEGALVDPTSPFVRVYDPDGMVLSSGIPTKEAIGLYYFPVAVTTAAASKEGWYQAYWEGNIGGTLRTMDKPQTFYVQRQPWQWGQPDYFVQSIRRLLGDTNPNGYRIPNIDMFYFVEDAVNEVQSVYNMGYVISVDNMGINWNQALTAQASALFKLKCIILVLRSMLLDFSFNALDLQVGDIRVNVKNTMAERREMLKGLESQYDSLIKKIQHNNAFGYEIDTYVTGTIINYYDPVIWSTNVF